MNKKNIIPFILFILFLFVMSSCIPSSDDTNQEEVQIRPRIEHTNQDINMFIEIFKDSHIRISDVLMRCCGTKFSLEDNKCSDKDFNVWLTGNENEVKPLSNYNENLDIAFAYHECIHLLSVPVGIGEVYAKEELNTYIYRRVGDPYIFYFGSESETPKYYEDYTYIKGEYYGLENYHINIADYIDEEFKSVGTYAYVDKENTQPLTHFLDELNAYTHTLRIINSLYEMAGIEKNDVYSVVSSSMRIHIASFMYYSTIWLYKAKNANIQYENPYSITHEKKSLYDTFINNKEITDTVTHSY
ncbi:hypothetical protein JXB41_02300 [Candidatus Woesearchaeota archaeon]|nr:hypothetical protein [Candidatus Woesearchaeota archaeon]